MDFDLLPQLIIIFSIAGILFIVGRNFSKVKEAAREEIFLKENEKEKKEKEKFIYLYKRAVRRINKEKYQKKMADFWVWFEKFLRRLRIVVLKLDSRMSLVLERLRKKNARSIENLKEMATATEKNMRKSKEMEELSGFLSGKGTYGKRRKMWKNPSVNLEEKTEESLADTNKSMNSSVDDAAKIEIADSPLVLSEDLVLEKENGAVEVYYAETEEIAVAEIENVIETLPEDARKETVAKEDIANIQDEMEKPEEIESFEAVMTEASEKNEKDEENNIGTAESADEEKVRTKREQECIEILMKDPADIKAYWRLGLIYSKRRNYEDALACFRQIVKIDPSYTKAKQKAIELMEKMKKKGK
ncbi:MAG: tetratricopeptide repeat protein [Patescibacteria group bacterium]